MKEDMPKKKKLNQTSELTVQHIAGEVPGNLNVSAQYYLKSIEPILEYHQKRSRSVEGTIISIPSFMKLIQVAQDALDDNAVPPEDRDAVKNCIDNLLKPMLYDQTSWLTKRKIVLAENHEDYLLFLHVLPDVLLPSEKRVKPIRKRRKYRDDGSLDQAPQ